MSHRMRPHTTAATRPTTANVPHDDLADVLAAEELRLGVVDRVRACRAATRGWIAPSRACCTSFAKCAAVCIVEPRSFRLCR